MSFQNQHEIEFTNVSRETFDFLLLLYDRHSDLFSALINKWLWWNRSVNLFSRHTNDELLRNHILHSLYLTLHLSVSTRTADKILDAGTGGGLPGLPMAIVCPEYHFLLADKVQKKTLALKEIIRSLKIPNASVLHANIHELNIPDSFRVISKHAFPIKVLLNALEGKKWTEIALLKGEDALTEIDEDLKQKYRFRLKKIDPPGHSFFQDKYIVIIEKPDSYHLTSNEQQ